MPPRDSDIARASGWPGAPGERLAVTVATFQRWLYLPHPGSLVIALATVAANRMSGDPVWLALVGPPGGGKTEILQALDGLDEVHHIATLTEAALLSGTPKRDKTNDATGGLLRELGAYGIIVCKDFTSVLAMNRDSRGQVLAALREVFDGAWTRRVGTDGGRMLHWSGKAGFLAGCTPTIDRHHGVMSAMGERLVFYRLPSEDQDELAMRTLDHVGSEMPMRAELRQAVVDLFANLTLPAETPTVALDDRQRLVLLAGLTARARSAVERDSYSREIDLIPDPEAPTRLVGALARLLTSLRVIGADEATAWRLVTKVAIDTVPALRMDVLRYLAESDERQTTSTIALACGYPSSTARRAAEELAAHGVLERHKPGRDDEWTLTAWTRARWPATTFPENPPHSRSALKIDRDGRPGLSGTVAADRPGAAR
jgi:hypothetical protein